jgi:hypothetical protein
VCNVESREPLADDEGEEEEEEEEETSSSSSSSSSNEKGATETSMSKKRNIEEVSKDDNHSKTLKTGLGAAEEEEEDNDGEVEDDDDEDEVAWQCLDMARDLYQKALTSSDISSELRKRLNQDLARTISRIGDLNMFQNRFADALIEYELCIKLRGENKDSSVENVCRLADANMQVRKEERGQGWCWLSLFQLLSIASLSISPPLLFFFFPSLKIKCQVAFAYLEHIAVEGEVDVVATSHDGSTLVVTQGKECMQQCLAFRDQAKTMTENLINRLARERVSCNKEVIV